MAEVPPSAAPSKARVFARRLSSTLLLWGLVAAVLVSRREWAYLLLIAGLTVLATLECHRMARASGLETRIKTGAIGAVLYCAVLHALLSRGIVPPPWLDAAALFAVTAGCFLARLRRPVEGAADLLSIAYSVLVFAWIGLFFNFTARILYLFPPEPGSGLVHAQGSMLVLWLLVVTKFSDMGAYLAGSLFGKHKMCPNISPAKTWEGFLGALALPATAGVGMALFFPDTLSALGGPVRALVVALVLSLLAVLGDLAESFVKRALHAKDSGHILPGIGGSLDLIDSVCFTAPVLYFILEATLPEA